MQTNYYIRHKGRELLRINVWAVMSMIALTVALVCFGLLAAGCESHMVSHRNYTRIEDVADTLAIGANSGKGLAPEDCADAANELGDVLDRSKTIGASIAEGISTYGGLVPSPWGDLLTLVSGVAAVYVGAKAKSAYLDRPSKQRKAIARIKADPKYCGAGEFNLKDQATQMAVAAAMGHEAWNDFVAKNPHLV